MKSYSTYAGLTATILMAMVYAVYEGMLVWLVTKFPDPTILMLLGCIATVFLWAYVHCGHSAAYLIARERHAFELLLRGESPVECLATIHLHKVRALRERGAAVGQTDFSSLYYKEEDLYYTKLHEAITDMDTVRVGLFFAALTLTLMGVVQGLGSQTFPTNAEEAKLFAFSIITGIGLAYLPAAACATAGMILFLLSSVLQRQAEFAVTQFSERLYLVAHLNEPAPATRGTPSLIQEEAHAPAS